MVLTISEFTRRWMGRAKRWETLVRVERETTGGERMSEMNEREERRGVERID